MDLIRPGPESAPFQIRALAMVAGAAENGLEPPQRALWDALAQFVFGYGENIETAKPLSPAQLAVRVDDPAQARQLIRFMVVMCLADGRPSQGQMSLLDAFAAALGVEEPAVKIIGHLAAGRLLRFRLAFMRRSHARHYLRNTYRMSGGIRPVVQALLRFRGLIPEDSATAARFRSLELLPEDTLGHRFFHHCVDADLPFPGEKGGFPEGAIYHDVTHVLSGYDTSPEGEMKNAAFQAGYTKDDHDFFVWLFSIVLHAARINLLPFPIPVVPGILGQDGLALDILWELERGNALPRDLGDQWDFWPYAELPIDIAREQLGVPPRSVAANDRGSTAIATAST